MKPSLERTAILSKDVSEQEPECKFVVMIPESSIILACDMVNHETGEIQVFAGGQMVAAFAESTKWVMVRKDCLDIVPREIQIRRMADNMREEKELWNKIMPEFKVRFEDFDEKEPGGSGEENGGRGFSDGKGYGHYL